MREIKSNIDEGRDVILHCRAGAHRAALAFVHALVFGLGISYSAAMQELTDIRHVKLHQILEAQRRDDGTYSEAHSKYLPKWENWAFHDNSFRFAPASRRRHDAPPLSSQRCRDDPQALTTY